MLGQTITQLHILQTQEITVHDKEVIRHMADTGRCRQRRILYAFSVSIAFLCPCMYTPSLANSVALQEL